MASPSPVTHPVRPALPVAAPRKASDTPARFGRVIDTTLPRDTLEVRPETRAELERSMAIGKPSMFEGLARRIDTLTEVAPGVNVTPLIGRVYGVSVNIRF